MRLINGYREAQLEHADLETFSQEEIAKAYKDGHCAALLGAEPDPTINHDTGEAA